MRKLALLSATALCLVTSSAFALSVGIIFVYYVFIRLGEQAGDVEQQQAAAADDPFEQVAELVQQEHVHRDVEDAEVHEPCCGQAVPLVCRNGKTIEATDTALQDGLAHTEVGLSGSDHVAAQPAAVARGTDDEDAEVDGDQGQSGGGQHA